VGLRVEGVNGGRRGEECATPKGPMPAGGLQFVVTGVFA